VLLVFSAPPRGTGLHAAPSLTPNLTLAGGSTLSASSTAVDVAPGVVGLHLSGGPDRLVRQRAQHAGYGAGGWRQP
jgi:hypothetical protein